MQTDLKKECPEQIFLGLANFAKYIAIHIIPVMTIYLETNIINYSKRGMGFFEIVIFL